MSDSRVVVKLGNDYIKSITQNGVCVTSLNEEKLIFDNEKVAQAFTSPIKFFNPYDEVKVILVEEDNKEAFFVGTPLKDLLSKARPMTVERAKELFEKHSVISLSKRYNVKGETVYMSYVNSQRNSYCTYSVEIVVDKDKNLISSSCTCPDRESHQNPLCKHILATIMAILDI